MADSQPDSQVEVVDNPDQHRYEARDADGTVLGFSRHRLTGDTVVFTHTEVDPDAGQSGLGSALVRGALDDVRAHGGQIVALCSFVHGWIDRHQEYADLVADADR